MLADASCSEKWKHFKTIWLQLAHMEVILNRIVDPYVLPNIYILDFVKR